jgi:hypothetical protein
MRPGGYVVVVLLGLVVWTLFLLRSVWLRLESSRELRRRGARVGGAWLGVPGYLRRVHDSLPLELQDAGLRGQIRRSDIYALVCYLSLPVLMILIRVLDE